MGKIIVGLIVLILVVMVGSGIDFMTAQVKQVGIGEITDRLYVPSTRKVAYNPTTRQTTTTGASEKYIVYVKVNERVLNVTTTQLIYGQPNGTQVRVSHRKGLFDWGYSARLLK